MQDVKEKIELLVKRICRESGAQMVELNIKGNPNDLYIQILADKPGGGITIGECVIINKSVVAAIEQEKFLPRETFSLEVSSPGIDKHR
jgi:ribosome maturation factor RimP